MGRSLSISDLVRVDPYCWKIPRSYRVDMRVDVHIFLSEELLKGIEHDLSLEQCVNVATLPGILKAAIAMPDIHQGYGFPIGGVAAMDPQTGVVSPGGVGFDINCGARLLRSPLTEDEVRPHLEKLVTDIAQAIPSGAGKEGPLALSPAELDRVLNEGLPWAEGMGFTLPGDLASCEAGGFMPGADAGKVSSRAKQRGHAQLGTLGAGNHFLEIQCVERILDPTVARAFGLFENQVVVMIHSGSRGLGHQVGTDYIRLMGPAMAREKISLPDRQLACAPVASPEGKSYLAAMAAACNFAWCNRQLLTFRTREIFAKLCGCELPMVYDVAHNIAKFERHRIDGKEMEVLVHRKGATRSFPPGHPNIPDAYQKSGQPVLIPGDMGRNSYILAGLPAAMDRSFGSVCHGAGRLLSRTAARERQNFYEIDALLKSRGVIARAASRSGITEEAPDAYKDVNDVVAVIEGAGLAKRVARLRPLGVVKG